MRAAGGLDLAVDTAHERDILVVPGFEFTQSLDLDELLHGLHPEIDFIKDQARSGTLIVSICVGAFLLAEAGVLNGRRATTSWLFAQRLAHRYPEISVDADALVLTDTGVTTSAGFSAMYDVALTLVQREHGPDVARSVARLALVDDARSSQTPYVDAALLPTSESDFIAAAKSLLAERLGHRYELADIARGLHVSPRTLLRRFKRDTGQTPLQYVQSARVDRARHLLETTDLTLARVASDVGYQDPSSFSVLFTRHTGHTPSRYRGTFGRNGRTS